MTPRQREPDRAVVLLRDEREPRLHDLADLRELAAPRRESTCAGGGTSRSKARHCSWRSGRSAAVAGRTFTARDASPFRAGDDGGVPDRGTWLYACERTGGGQPPRPSPASILFAGRESAEAGILRLDPSLRRGQIPEGARGRNPVSDFKSDTFRFSRASWRGRGTAATTGETSSCQVSGFSQTPALRASACAHVMEVVERLVGDAPLVEPAGEAVAGEAPLGGERDAAVGDAVSDVDVRPEPGDRRPLAPLAAGRHSSDRSAERRVPAVGSRRST